MSVTVDHEKWDVAQLKFSTLGQVFDKIKASNRLIVRLVIDGTNPEASHLPTIGVTPIVGKTIFIETVDPTEASNEVLVQAYAQLDGADKIKDEAAEFLRASKWPEAMEKLRQCLEFWQTSQRAIVTVGKIFKIDVENMIVNGRPLRALSDEFARQLRDLQAAIEVRDLVGISDVLVYETAHTGDSWRAAIEALQAVIGKRETVQSGA